MPHPTSQSRIEETGFSEPIPPFDTDKASEIDETPFEADETVNGVKCSIFQRHDYDRDEDLYCLELSSGPESEEINLKLSASDAKALFDHTTKNVPAGHSENLYIAYGKA